jgi:hypothetical protein
VFQWCGRWNPREEQGVFIPTPPELAFGGCLRLGRVTRLPPEPSRVTRPHMPIDPIFASAFRLEEKGEIRSRQRRGGAPPAGVAQQLVYQPGPLAPACGGSHAIHSRRSAAWPRAPGRRPGEGGRSVHQHRRSSPGSTGVRRSSINSLSLLLRLTLGGIV